MSMQREKYPFFYHLACLILSLSTVINITLAQNRRLANTPISVEYTTAQLAEQSEEINAIGILLPSASVIIKPEIAGKVITIGFKEGQPVNKGDLLVKIDDTNLQASVKEATAKVMLAEQNLKRLNAVIASSSQQQVDTAKANLLQAQANLEIAQSQLAKSSILAPFSGVVSISDIDVGEYIQTGSELLTLTDLNQLKLEFSLPERFAHLTPLLKSVSFKVDYSDRLFIANVYAISPVIDQETRSLTIRAMVDNKDQILIPGLFVRLTLQFAKNNQKVLRLPEETMFAQNGKQWIYIVDQNEKENKKTAQAKLTEIKVITRQFGYIDFESTIQPGQLVVKTGQQKLKDKSLLINHDNRLPIQPLKIN